MHINFQITTQNAFACELQKRTDFVKKFKQKKHHYKYVNIWKLNFAKCVSINKCTLVLISDCFVSWKYFGYSLAEYLNSLNKTNIFWKKATQDKGSFL